MQSHRDFFRHCGAQKIEEHTPDKIHNYRFLAKEYPDRDLRGRIQAESFEKF